MILSHAYSTYGNHGQHKGATDYVRVGDSFVRCDDLDGAVVTDESTHSRKNVYEKIKVECQLAAGTLGKTVEREASSRRSTRTVTYWRVDELGEKAELKHVEEIRNDEHVAETYHVLEDGENVLVGRAPRGVRTNRYKGRCCDCGERVPAERGELVKQSGRWTVRCVDCFLKTREKVSA